MQNTAFIFENGSISYSGIMLFLAALSAVCMLLALRIYEDRPLFPALLLCTLTVALSLPLSRLVHWYSNAMQYASFRSAMTDWSVGGFAPLGVFAAALLSLLVLRGIGWIRDTGSMLDAMAVAGSLGMAVGRMACRFSTVNRSKFTLEKEIFHRFPLMVSSVLPSGGTEWRIATFALESIFCLLLFVLLLSVYGPVRGAKRARKRWKNGNVFLLFLSIYGAGTILLDSTRYDPLYMRSNGFISITQLFCVAALLFAFVLLSVRSVRCRGLRPWHGLVWTLFAAGAGVAGYMEYFVQRRSHRFLTAYPVMGAGLAVMAVLTAVLLGSTRGPARAAAPRKPKKRPGSYQGAHAKK